MITCKVTGTARTHAGEKTPVTTMYFDSDEICEWTGAALSVSTTGYVGGDSAYTEIKFIPTNTLNFMPNIPGEYCGEGIPHDEFSIVAYGDWEIMTLKNMFNCALQALNALTGDEIYDGTGWSIKRWYGEGGDIYMTTNPAVQDCYKEYCDYCTGLHFKPVSKQKFSRRMCSYYHYKSIPYKGADGRSVRRYFNTQDDSMNSMRIKHTANK